MFRSTLQGKHEAALLAAPLRDLTIRCNKWISWAISDFAGIVSWAWLMLPTWNNVLPDIYFCWGSTWVLVFKTAYFILDWPLGSKLKGIVSGCLKPVNNPQLGVKSLLLILSFNIRSTLNIYHSTESSVGVFRHVRMSTLPNHWELHFCHNVHIF